MDLHEYFGLCADHDWMYIYSNDRHRYKKGIKESVALMEYYKLGDEFNKYCEVYQAWRDFNLAGCDMPSYYDFVDEPLI